MKKPVLLIVLIFSSLMIFAKTELPQYGEIDKSDLQLKRCEFDKKADAYLLMSSGDVSYKVVDGEFNIVTERRIRIKILTEKGLEKAHIKIRFLTVGNYEIISDISGITYNLDSAGNINTIPLNQKSIAIKKIDNQVSEVDFELTNVQVGSVIEYKFTKTKKSISNIDDWYFQSDIPTRVSVYRISIPFMFIFSSQVFSYQDVRQEREVTNEDVVYRKKHLQFSSQLKTYTAENIPGLKEEPFMGAAKDYLERLEFRLTNFNYGNGQKGELNATWDQISSGLLKNETFGGQITKGLPHTKKLDELLATVTDSYDKMLVIYNYVRKKMNWNEERGVYPSIGVKQAWNDKKGNEADINLILINLLKDEGIAAYPLLVSTKDNGTIDTQYPFLQQFNTTMAYVVIDSTNYVLNAADKFLSAFIIPANVLNNDAFVIDNAKGGWVILSNDKSVLRNTVALEMQINPWDSISGKAAIRSYGYAESERLKFWEKDTASLVNYYKGADSSMQIRNMEVTGNETDSTELSQKFDFAIPFASSKVRDSFTVNLFQGLKNNPFVDSIRQTDINLYYKRFYTIEGTIDISGNYKAVLPENLKIAMPDSSIVLERFFLKNNGVISFSISVNFKKTYYDAKSYPQLESFYKKLYSVLNEKIAIKRR